MSEWDDRPYFDEDDPHEHRCRRCDEPCNCGEDDPYDCIWCSYCDREDRSVVSNDINSDYRDYPDLNDLDDDE